jgi:Tol biopolymer transport system component
VPVRTALSYDGRYLAYVTGDFDWFDMEAIDASGRPAKGTRGTMPPQFLQDYGDLHVLDVVERSSTYLGRIHGNQFGFHPSKNLLAYISNENIEVLDLDSKARTAIHIDKPIRVISNLAWSPDGKYLVFMQYRGPHFLISRGSGASLWVATPDGSRLVPLPVAFTTSGFHRWNIVWRND